MEAQQEFILLKSCQHSENKSLSFVSILNNIQGICTISEHINTPEFKANRRPPPNQTTTKNPNMLLSPQHIYATRKILTWSNSCCTCRASTETISCSLQVQSNRNTAKHLEWVCTRTVQAIATSSVLPLRWCARIHPAHEPHLPALCPSFGSFYPLLYSFYFLSSLMRNMFSQL